MEDNQGKRKEPNISILRRHWELVLLNLSQAVFKRRWLMVALNSRAQAKLPAYADNNWSARPLAHVIDHLEQQELIHLRKGKTYSFYWLDSSSAKSRRSDLKEGHAQRC